MRKLVTKRSHCLKISGIIWLREIVEKISRKHRVEQEEIREILSGSTHFRFVEKDTEGARMSTRRWARQARAVILLFFSFTKRAGRR